MLNGLYPLLVFTVKPSPPTPGSDPLTKKKGLIDDIITDVGLPIPIYLHTATGITVDEETKAIDIETVPETVVDRTTQKSKILYDQRAVNSMTSISLLAKKDSVALSVLFALAEQAVHYIVKKEYAVHYYNGPILLMNGLLRSLSTSAGPDDTLIRVNLQLSKGDDTSFQTRPLNVLVNSRGPIP